MEVRKIGASRYYSRFSKLHYTLKNEDRFKYLNYNLDDQDYSEPRIVIPGGVRSLKDDEQEADGWLIVADSVEKKRNPRPKVEHPKQKILESGVVSPWAS